MGNTIPILGILPIAAGDLFLLNIDSGLQREVHVPIAYAIGNLLARPPCVADGILKLLTQRKKVE